MTRYVIGPDVAIRLAHDQAVIRGGHQILAPALLRSQVLSLLYQAVRRGEMTRKDTERQLEYVCGLRIRLLGDRVLQNVAWKAVGLLGWPDTFDAEYVALTGTPAGNTAWPSPAARAPADVLRDYQAAIQDSDRAIRAAGDPDVRFAVPVDGNRHTLRWVMVHMASETARHAGHADIHREQLD